MQFGWIAVLVLLGLLVGLQPDVYYVTKIERGDLVYSTLSEAIAAAKPGSTIKVKAGVYRENLVINKSLRIEAFSADEGSSEVFIRASDPNQPVFKIAADNVRLSGLIIEGGSAGIELSGVKGAKLIANEVRGDRAGIVLRATQGSLIQGNKVQAEVGLALEVSSGNRIFGNEIVGSELGLRLAASQENELTGNKLAGKTAILLQESHQNSFLKNTLWGSERGLVLDRSGENLLKETAWRAAPAGARPLEVLGEAVADWLQEIDTTNKIDGRPIYYLVGKEGLEITPIQNPGYLALIRCKNITVAGIELRDTGISLIETEGTVLRSNRLAGAEVGLRLWRTKSSLLEGNVITGGEVGIWLRDSTGEILSRNSVSGSGIIVEGGGGHLLEGNEVVGSARRGISLEASNGNKLEGNTVRGSKEYGLLIQQASGNSVTKNEFLGNWVGIFLQGANANIIVENRAGEGQYGLYLAGSTGNEIARNDLSGNGRAGLGGALAGNKIGENKE